MDLDKSAIKVLVFDLDGTLYNLGIDWVAVKAELTLIAGDAVDPLGDITSIPTEKRQEAETYLRASEQSGVEHGSVIIGAADAVKTLARTYRIGIVSRNYHETIQQVIDKLALGDVFAIGKEDVVQQKPHPEGIEKVLAHFGVSAGEALFIGDTYHDVGAAHAAGVVSVIVSNPLNDYVPEGADRYIATLSELID